jgi:hypothetical protein
VVDGMSRREAHERFWKALADEARTRVLRESFTRTAQKVAAGVMSKTPAVAAGTSLDRWKSAMLAKAPHRHVSVRRPTLRERARRRIWRWRRWLADWLVDES